MTGKQQHANAREQIRRLEQVDRTVLPPDGGPGFNRLIFARSPYLLQHAENPVDWYPWGEEAFEKAKQEDKPVFLSIGYATCHWCHVMERESFVDGEVAAVLNEKFVAVKVDREERPDIDDQYMTVAQMMIGGGGWPLTIVMSPDREPFFAATYLPRKATKDLAGIIEVLEKIDEVWRTDRAMVAENCAQVVKSLAMAAVPAAGVLEGDQVADAAFRALKMAYDGAEGGFGEAPKFPLPHYVSFLLRYGKRNEAPMAGEMALHTLTMMRCGGIFDQIGFGLHRYSVDRKWLVPHFEKMLYDQAMGAHASLDAFRATGERKYAYMAEEMFEFVLDELTSPDGGFYSALDAETEGVEGEFYTWTPDEVRDAVGDEAALPVMKLYGITPEGNFEGRSIPTLRNGPEERAAMETWRRELLAKRCRRPRPLRDEKILTSWNGLMTAALAKGYAATGNERYLRAAEAAVGFIRNRSCTGEGRLLRSWYRGEASIHGFLEDYAFFIWGLLELYEATLEREYLEQADAYTREMLRLFIDKEEYGLYDTASDAENVLVRKKGGHDGVIPCGNSVAAMNLIRLGKVSNEKRLLEEGKGILRAFMGNVSAQPLAGLHFLAALDYLNGPDTEITIEAPAGWEGTAAMLRAVGRRFIPGMVLRFSEKEAGTGERGSVHICGGGSCRLPVHDPEGLEALLDGMS